MARRRRRRGLTIPKVIGAALSRIFGQTYESDSIELSNGIHEIEICTKKNADRVWVSFNDDEGSLPVCGGNVDKIGVVKACHGFILHADIRSTGRTVRWFASVSK